MSKQIKEVLEEIERLEKVKVELDNELYERQLFLNFNSKHVPDYIETDEQYEEWEKKNRAENSQLTVMMLRSVNMEEMIRLLEESIYKLEG